MRGNSVLTLVRSVHQGLSSLVRRPGPAYSRSQGAGCRRSPVGRMVPCPNGVLPGDLMTWVLDLGVGARTKAIARAICRARSDMRLVTAPQAELTGVIVCSASSSALEQTLATAASANAHVIVVSEADHRLEAWSLLAHGATDLMIWHDDPRPIMARLARLVEVENVVESAP